MKVLATCGPKEKFVINDRTDDGPLRISDGEVFEVTEDRGRFLVANYFPRLRPAPGSEENPVVPKVMTPDLEGSVVADKPAPKPEAERAAE